MVQQDGGRRHNHRNHTLSSSAQRTVRAQQKNARVTEKEDDQNDLRTDSTRTSSGQRLSVLVSTATAPSGFNRRRFARDESVGIAAGAIDESGTVPAGLSGKQLDITVTDPTGGETVFSETTDADGGTSVTYDLSGDSAGSGSYVVSVTDGSDHSASTTFEVGPDVLILSGFEDYAFVNDTTEVVFLSVEGTTALANDELTLRILDSDETTVTEQTKTTDADGFASLSFTPQSVGSYEIEVERNGSVVKSESISAIETLGVGNFAFGNALSGQTNIYPGLLITGNGPAANVDFTLEFYTDFVGGNLLTEKSVTTDEHGFFSVEYDISSDFGSGRLELAAKTPDGSQIPLQSDDIDVTDPDSEDGGGGGSSVDLSAGFGRGFEDYAPGEQATLNIEATDDGSPIAEQDVDVILGSDRDGTPIRSTTVTTNSDGKATVSITLPGEPFDGIEPSGLVGMVYNDTTYEEFIGTDIRKYDYGFNYPEITPGEASTYSIKVTNRATGNSVEGVPYWFSATYAGGLYGSFGKSKLVSGADGTAETSIDVPTDLLFETFSIAVNRYRGENTASVPRISYPGSLSVEETPVPGEPTTFSFTVPDDVSLTGIVFGEVANKTFASTFSGPGTFTATVPAEAEDGEFLSFDVWAIDDQGQKYRDSAFGETPADAVTVSVSGATDIGVGGEATLSISAENADEIRIEDVWTDWTFSSSALDGGSVTDAIDDSGSLTVTYGSTQSTANPSVTLSLPDRYVGGTYELLVTAIKQDGETAQDTALVTI